MTIVEALCTEFKVLPWQIEAVIRLLDEGNTLPFIARYRKEQHGSLDDQQLRSISERLTQLRNLEQRKQEISESLRKLEVWTEELQKEIDAAETLGRLEDIYRPYRPKRRTRAMVARERGLEPLADKMYNVALTDPVSEARKYLGDKVASVDDALAGARDIIAERLSETASVRETLRQIFKTRRIVTKATKKAAAKTKTAAAKKPAAKKSAAKAGDKKESGAKTTGRKKKTAE